MILMRSESLFGLSLVTLTFDDDVGRVQVADASSRSASSRADLPEGVDARARARRHAARRDLPVPRRRATATISTRLALRAGVERRAAPRAGAGRRRRGDLRRLSEGGARRGRPARACSRTASRWPTSATRSRSSNRNVGGGFLRTATRSWRSAASATSGTPDDMKNDRAARARAARRSRSATSRRVVAVAHAAPRRRRLQRATGEVAEGFVLLRRGENPSRGARRRPREGRRAQRRASCRKGMKIVPFYDRTTLVEQHARTRSTTTCCSAPSSWSPSCGCSCAASRCSLIVAVGHPARAADGVHRPAR